MYSGALHHWAQYSTKKPTIKVGRFINDIWEKLRISRLRRGPRKTAPSCLLCHLDAVGVFAGDTVVVDDIGHSFISKLVMDLLGERRGSIKVKRCAIHTIGLHVPPILLGGASFSLKAGVFRNMDLWRGFIVIKRLGFWRGATTGAKRKDFDNTHIGLLMKRQHIPRPHSACGFGGKITVYPHLARGDDRGCDRPRFKKPRLPQPFVEPDGVAFIAQPFFSAARAAKGLSGSIFFSALGFALNFWR